MTKHSSPFCTLLVLSLLCGLAQAQVLFQDEMTSAAGWAVNANNADNLITFGYDYSSDDIPEAPNSQGGDVATTGVKLEANLSTASLSVFTLYPVGESFSGDYKLTFDTWMNYDVDELINGSASGTTEFIGGGIGYDNVAADVGPGAQLIVTGDGGSASDWRAFAGVHGSPTVFVPAANMDAGTRQGADPYYSDFLPGVAPPAGQAQFDDVPGAAGSPGFQWITFEFVVESGTATASIIKPSGERLSILTYDDDPYTSDGNISLVYADFFTSVTSQPGLTFGLIDNVLVEQLGVMLAGDANGDGSVDILDLDILSGNFGAMGGATVATGDFNGDGNVDILDLDILSGNFGAMASASAAVPEPASLAVALTAALFATTRRRVR